MEPTDTAARRSPGEIMRDLRKLLAPLGRKTLSQAKLAERLGYNEEYLQSVESGRRPMQPHFVDEVAELRDEARFPDAFNRLIEELRAAVTAHWAGVAQPPVSSEDEGATTRAASNESLADELNSLTKMSEGKLDGLRGALDAFSAKAEGRLDGLGGKLDRTEGTLAVLGAKIDSTSAKTEEALGAVGAKVEAASAKTGGQLAELSAKADNAGGKLDQAGHTLQLMHAQQGGMDRRVRRLGQALLGLTFVVALGFTTLVLVAWRGGMVDLFGGFDGVPGIHGEMGEPKTGKPVPDHPLPAQSRPPCGMGAETISGGCWLKMADQKPPCLPRFYFHGDACYVPAAAGWKPDAKPQSLPNPE